MIHYNGGSLKVSTEFAIRVRNPSPQSESAIRVCSPSPSPQSVVRIFYHAAQASLASGSKILVSE